MKNVLFLLGGYKPKPSANGICADMIIDKLLQQGCHVYCISNIEPGLSEFEIINEVEIHRIKNQLYKTFRKKASLVQSPLMRSIYKIAEKVTDVGSLYFYKNSFPIVSPQRIKSYIVESKKIINERNIDTVIAVNLPCETIVATYKLKEEYPHLWVVAYFLDPIAGGLHHKFLNPETEAKKGLEFERRMLEKFDVVVVQKEHQRHFIADYNEKERRKISYLGVPFLSDKTTCATRKSKKRFTAVYAGGISKKNRNPQFIIEVFKKIKNAKLVMYITNDKSIAISMANSAPNIEVHGQVSHEQLDNILQEADCFINIGNTQSMQAPSKLIEYMCYGKPIISTYRVDDDTSAYYMKKYPLGIYIDERNISYKDAAELICSHLIDAEKQIEYMQVQKMFEEYTPEAFINAITKDKIDRE